MIRNGTTYHDQTPAAVVDELERAREKRYKVFIRYGDSDTGRDWLEESDVEGRVGRSTVHTACGLEV